MNDAEFSVFVAANPGREYARAVLARVDDAWRMIVAETHSDGTFRHVDFSIEEIDRNLDLAFTILAGSTPESETAARGLVEWFKANDPAVVAPDIPKHRMLDKAA